MQKIIYIAGSGHSGSTLLDMIIGSSENCISLGELEFLKDFVNKRKQPKNIKHPQPHCLCGEKLEKCSFWSRMLNLDISKTYNYESSFFEKITIALKIIFGGKFEFPYNDEKLLKELLKNAKKAKGKKVDYILDSSKDIRRMIYLDSLDLDVKVIHLVRDSRGVVNSFEKMGRSWLPILFDWIAENILISRYSTRLKKKNYLRLSYDSFAQNPEKYLKKINKQFGLKIDTKKFVSKVNKEKYHHISGNPMNMKKLEGIRYDLSWKKRLSNWKIAVIGFVTYIPNKIWVHNEK